MSRPFEFVAPLPNLAVPIRDWRDRLRRIEDAGFSVVSVSDHIAAGWGMEPLIALAAAAAMTERVRLMTLVLNSDLRHPAQIYSAASTLDAVSDGRLDLGLGAGWMASEYAALGVPFDPPAARVERLAETVHVIKALFEGEPVTYRGAHHQIQDLRGAPAPVQRPHPPILLAGGGRPILELAGREADLAGVAPVFREGAGPPARLAELRAERAQRKIVWLREAATRAGRDPDAIVLQLNVAVARLGGHQLASEGWLRDIARDAVVDRELRGSPYVLAGDLEACANQLEAARDRFGFSRIRFPGDPMPWAELVQRLTDR